MKIISNNGMGERIKAIRKSLGKNQEEFGQLFNPPAPKSSVSYWENGGGPNKRRLQKIAELGGVSVKYLINGNQLSVTDTQKLLDKAAHSTKISDEDQEKINEYQLGLASSISKITSSWEKIAQHQIKEQQNIIKDNPLSAIELQSYGDFLVLFNLVRLHASEDQQVDFRVLINMLCQLASGTIKYDKEDILPNIDKLLSSFPVKKD